MNKNFDLSDPSLIPEIVRRVYIALDEKKGGGIPIGISARHVHLSPPHLYTLFGEGYELTPDKILMGGQFAAAESLTLVGANLRAVEKVRIIGPLRNFSQVEVSRTDSFMLGIDPPVRDSGDLRDAAPVTLVGPRGVLYLENGCIIAKRHVHMSVPDAASFGVTDRQLIRLKLSGGRGGIMDNVLVRVSPEFTLEIHIDTDEANAFGITRGAKAFME
jgi:putative phosphotransacetylase